MTGFTITKTVVLSDKRICLGYFGIDTSSMLPISNILPTIEEVEEVFKFTNAYIICALMYDEYTQSRYIVKRYTVTHSRRYSHDRV